MRKKKSVLGAAARFSPDFSDSFPKKGGSTAESRVDLSSFFSLRAHIHINKTADFSKSVVIYVILCYNHTVILRKYAFLWHGGAN